jgi:hypothetical protein
LLYRFFNNNFNNQLNLCDLLILWVLAHDMQNVRLTVLKRSDSNPKSSGIDTLMMKGVRNMKVAVSSNGDGLDAQLDPRFGRCAFFLVVNPEDMSFEAFNNESAAQGGGAGIQAARFLASQGVAAVITGNCGPNAVQTTISGRVAEAVSGLAAVWDGAWEAAEVRGAVWERPARWLPKRWEAAFILKIKSWKTSSNRPVD